MRERFLINPKNGLGMRFGQGDRPVERFRFTPQMETFASFIADKGHPEDKRFTLSVNNRTEIWHKHEPGFSQRKLKVLTIGAHPDDTALSEGLEHVLVEQGRKGGKKETGLAVISVTPGHLNGDKDTRIREDVKGTKCLGADMYINLGFTDGNLPAEKEQVKARLASYIRELQPDIIILPDHEDKSHDDHVAVSEAAVEALLENQQHPIVIYTDHQFGNKEITEGTVGFRLEPQEHAIFEMAFRDHKSQTNPASEAVDLVLARTGKHAEKYAPEIKQLGILRQDLRPEFSQVPIATHLGEKVVSLQRDTSFRENEQVAERVITHLEKDEIQENLPAIKKGLSALMADATGLPLEACSEMIEHRADDFDLAVAVTEGNQLLSFGGYTIHEVDGLGTILYESVKMTAKKAQGKGFGRQVTQKAYDLVKPDFFALRTQNPAEVASVQNTFPEAIFAPFDFDYPENPALQFGLMYMQEVLGVDKSKFDPDTGVCPGYYGQRIGDFVINTGNKQINAINERFKELGIDQDLGDAIFMMGRVGERALLADNGIIYEEQFA